MIDQPGRADDEADVETTSWHWLFGSEAGVAVAGPQVSFESQEAAEDWLRDEFEELQETGIATVTLLDGEHAVYGPMFLAPDAPGPEEAIAEF